MAGQGDCGLVGFYPRWLRNKATPRTFLIVYGLLGTVQAMSYIYIVITLTTLEKRFKIQSRTTGIILSGNEISQILSLVLIHYGSSGHRPRWIAVGVAFSAASCLVLTLPHFIYGPGRDALALTQEYLNHTLLNATATSKEVPVCPRTPGQESCNEEDLSDISVFPRLLVFVSQFILGIGTTLYYGLGQTYLDDNAKKKNTPMLLGFTFALRTIGPVIGFLLGYFCLSLYIDPTLHPVITDKDPRWLGAWWLGWIILGVTMALFAALVAMFPRELAKPKQDARKDGEIPLKLDPVIEQTIEPVPEQIPSNSTTSMRDFSKALKRLMSNRILLFNNMSAVFYVLGASGFITFLAKYVEVQYGTSAAGGTAVAGPISLIGMVFGFLLSGVFISKFKPGPRVLLGWNVLIGVGFLLGTIMFAFLGCPDSGIQGLNVETSKLNLSAECNLGCGCEGIKYAPVCHEATSTTFFSACHAGCRTILNDKTFGSCACVAGSKSLLTKSHSTSFGYPEESFSTVKAGPCASNCASAYFWFLITSCIIQTLACSGKIGTVLVNYRAVQSEDKSVAQGFAIMLISLFALIPGPIIYGAVIDSTCLIWEESCGQRGNCWFYNKDKFRYFVNISAAGFIFIGLCCDFYVWYKVKGLDLYGASEDEKRREFAKIDNPISSGENIKQDLNGELKSDDKLNKRQTEDVK